MFATRSAAFPANSNGAGTRSPRQRSSSDVYRAPCETQGLRPERGRIMHHVHYFPNRMDETVKLPGGYNKRWGHLENKKVIPADLRQDAVVAEEPHHNRLAEHAFVGCGGTPRKRGAVPSASAAEIQSPKAFRCRERRGPSHSPTAPRPVDGARARPWRAPGRRD